MSNISFGKTVSLKQAAQIILANPENRYMLVGEPGIGKSSIMKALSAALPTHEVSYIDCASLDLGDIAMPWVCKETGTTRYAPNARFKLHLGKPVVLMYDEFPKGMPPVQNMLHPTLEPHNPRLGDIPVPAGSYVFMTGNLSTDGVGDNLKAHTKNRVVRIHVRKSTAEEWLEWAANNEVNPVVMAWVHQYPHAMASYMDEGQENNPYIFQPKRMQDAFVTPRSLERASNIAWKREMLDTESFIAALTGAIGEAAARDMQAFVEYQDQLPSWESIITNPDTAKLPEGAGASSVLVFGAVQRIDKQNIKPFMQYLSRFEPEWQAAFAINVARNPQKQAVAFSSKAFADWVQANEDLL
jgi:energy-coupling factor transporter ATP-binding protein EcfA2